VDEATANESSSKAQRKEVQGIKRMTKLRAFSNKGFKDDDIMPLSFDTETAGLGGKLLLITACDFDSTHVFKGPDMVRDLFALMETAPYPAVWYAHHAQYDWRYFLDYIRENEIPCDISMRTETDIYQITLFLNGSRIVMRDSMAVYPGTLKGFAQAFTPESPKLEIDVANFDPENETHIEYAKRDTEILRKGMPRFDSLLRKHFGVSLGHTTAGTALKAWQNTIPDNVYYNPSKWGEREAFIREGYYGGLVFLTRTDVIEGAVTFDINSSYPHQMCEHGVPSGAVISTDDYKSGYMGIYRVRVRTPSNLVVPILPRRNEKGYMRWHAGEFDTVVTSSELIFAANQGYEILEVYEGVAFEERIFPFNDFIDKCKAIRFKYKGKSEETLAKLMQNSLYGKFGSRRERLTVFCPSEDDETLGATPIDEDGYFWLRKEFSEDLRCIPEWAVFITAHARLHLLRQIYLCGVENVIYGDTDSLTVLPHVSHLFDSGNDYGQWKLEKTWAEFRAIAPKVYSGRLDDGRFKGAAKGLPKKRMADEQWAAMLRGEAINVMYETLPALRVAMAKGVTPATSISRVSTNIANSANWELQGTRVYPKLAL
jgi:hypothetical protein